MGTMSNRNSWDNRAVQVSKAISHLLRHDLERSDIDFDTNDGWTRVDHMLALRSFKSRKITQEKVTHAVASCFNLRFLTKGDGLEMYLSFSKGRLVASLNKGPLMSITPEDVDNFPVWSLLVAHATSRQFLTIFHKNTSFSWTRMCSAPSRIIPTTYHFLVRISQTNAQGGYQRMASSLGSRRF